MLAYYAPEEAGFSPDRLQRLYTLLDEAAANGSIPGAAVLVARQGRAVAPYAVGRQFPTQPEPKVSPDSIFLVASVTKPVVAAALMLLVERGKLMISDRVVDHLPEFGSHGKEAVRVHHLLTHTSGLPDMLPENTELRRQHAPLSEFVRRIYDLELDFAPGTRVQYQSMGIALLGEIVERISGMALPEFLRQEIFIPLRMADSSLGIGELDQSRVVHVTVPEEQRGADWGWNQPYWWNFGAPWGGMFTTVSDHFRFCQMFLNGGTWDGVSVLSPATASAMTTDQSTHILTAHDPDRSGMLWGQTWGLGWTIPGYRVPDGGRAFFGDLSSPTTFGHGGATGTVVWVDPVNEVVCVLFTSEPSATRNGFLGRCSNLVAAAAL
ncbi:MAG: beta-lactamase family protein [Caldilineaceae bacterium]|nr:beta-lactamase family protein [Caldilineaceae bacterium]